PENHFVGKVNYIDYKTAQIERGNFFVPFVHKRQSFRYENELRVLRLNPPEGDGSDFFKRKTPEGIWVSVDLAQLISRVHVSPKSPPWFRDLVESVSKKYRYDFTVRRSDLDADPIF